MKLIGYFNAFLSNTVNINKHRLDQLDSRVNSIYVALRADEILGPFIRDKLPQGSWAHRTIIKPLEGFEFDADFMLVLDENPEWAGQPSRYVEEIYAALGRSSTYKDMDRTRKCRCVRITYANDCHIDIVAYLQLADGREVIANRDDDTWEDTDPAGLTAWINGKDATSGGTLRKVIRLLKFLRDHKKTFLGVRSVILTTLVGERVDASKAIADNSYYCDIPTTLKNIMKDLDAWLQDHPTRPSIADPSGSGTTFDHRWTDVTYKNFRERVHSYAQKITVAYDEEDKAQSLALWQEVFGEEFKFPAEGAGASAYSALGDESERRPGRAG